MVTCNLANTPQKHSPKPQHQVFPVPLSQKILPANPGCSPGADGMPPGPGSVRCWTSTMDTKPPTAPNTTPTAKAASGDAGPALTWLPPRRAGRPRGSARRGRRGAAPALGGPTRTAGPVLRGKSKHRLRQAPRPPAPPIRPRRPPLGGRWRRRGGGGRRARGSPTWTAHLAKGTGSWAPPFYQAALVHRRNRSPRNSLPEAEKKRSGWPGRFRGATPTAVPPARLAQACRSAGAWVPAPARCPGSGDPWPGAG